MLLARLAPASHEGGNDNMLSLWKADEEDGALLIRPSRLHNTLLLAGKVTWLNKDDGGFELVLQPRPERTPDHQIVGTARDDAVNQRSQVEARRDWLLVAAVIGYKRDPITDHLVVPRSDLCRQGERSAAERRYTG